MQFLRSLSQEREKEEQKMSEMTKIKERALAAICCGCRGDCAGCSVGEVDAVVVADALAAE